MNNIYQHYIIDLSSNNNFVQVPTVQGDGNNIRGFEVELIENGVPYAIDKSNCIIAIMGTKPDTHQIVNECRLTDNGYIQVDITSQMSAVKGRGDYQIVLMSRSTNSQLKSFPFHIITTPAAFDIDYIISTDEFQLLTKQIAQTSTAVNNANKAITDIRTLESSVETAEASRVNAEKARVNAEKNRVSAESTRNQNENTRKANETARQNAETNRANAETDRVNAENTRTSNEDTRIANENIRKSNETTRQNNENTRKSNESKRQTAETARTNAENDRNTAEGIRIANENARKTAESNRVSEETKRANAEITRAANETARQRNESARQSNESARQTNTEAVIDRATKAAKACEDIVAGTGMVMQTEKGAANGVATLDGNKKLTNSQLPIATTALLGAVKIGSNITVKNGTIGISKTNVTDALGFIPIKQTDTTTELISSTEPASGRQNVGDFWLQEY